MLTTLPHRGSSALFFPPFSQPLANDTLPIVMAAITFPSIMVQLHIISCMNVHIFLPISLSCIYSQLNRIEAIFVPLYRKT
jgi:hypothetical protein